MQSEFNQTFLMTIYQSSTQDLIRLGSFIKNACSSILTPYLQTAELFYHNHKEIILVVGAATITYIILKPSNKKSLPIKSKKTIIHKNMVRCFISDNQQNQCIDEVSTTTRKSVQNTQKHILQEKKKIVQQIFLERIDTCSENESQDKIFFEVFKTYQAA